MGAPQPRVLDDDEELDISDEAIAEALQESESVASGSVMAKSTKKATATKLEANAKDRTDRHKIIDVEDGNSATLHRAIGSRHADEETGMSPTPSKKIKKINNGRLCSVQGCTKLSQGRLENHMCRRHFKDSQASTRSGSVLQSAITQTGEPKDKVDLMKKDAQSFIAPYTNAEALAKFYPVQNGLTPSIVLQLLEDHEDFDPSIEVLIEALPKECGLVRDDQNHRNLIRHLYRNFQGEGNLLENRTGDKLPVSLQERDICVYAAILEKGFDFLVHFIPYRSREDVVAIYRRTKDKGFQRNEEHVAHVKRTIGLIESLEGSLGIEEDGSQLFED